MYMQEISRNKQFHYGKPSLQSAHRQVEAPPSKTTGLSRSQRIAMQSIESWLQLQRPWVNRMDLLGWTCFQKKTQLRFQFIEEEMMPICNASFHHQKFEIMKSCCDISYIDHTCIY